MGKDFYSILGVSKSAGEDDLKKAYRKLAMKWHPDKNQGSEEATKKFKEISEAYDVLNDPQKRQIYDTYGEEALKTGVPPPGTPGGAEGGFSGFGGPGGGGYSMDDETARKIFEQFFGGGGGGFSFGGGGMPGGGGARIFTTGGGRGGHGFGGMFGGMEDDEEVPYGGGGFGGFGGMPFGGAGMGGMGRGRGRPPAAKKVEVPLNLTLEELYTGTTKKRKVTRRIVDAASGRSMNVEETLEIPVKAGWKDGTKVTFEGKGDELPGQPAQDIVFVVKQKPHSKFLREGDDLVVKMSIPLTKALTAGVTVDVPTLDNRVLRVPLREVIYPGYERVVKSEGMPISKRGAPPGSKGDMKIRFNVQFPKKQLSGEESTSLERLLAGKM
ncbi:hypothetical protein Ndes2526B_g02703 [Nannochloris sp. 'desiccata']|nr:hypothetical protein KSW81_007014 [Chlorella desiccata (nom. nud.)]KAH7621889.1 putative DnaJ-like protein subfamily B member 13 [Chlorella desiccata (nom. nud.)]